MFSERNKVAPLPSSGTIRETAVPPNLAFTCAVASAKGPRDSMEDTHSIVVPFAGIHGQGLFGVFDGHGGKGAAKWCHQNYTQCLLGVLQHSEYGSINEAITQSFRDVDNSIRDLWASSDGEFRSGTTAVVAFLRLEDDSGKQSFVPPDHDPLATKVPGAERSSSANNHYYLRSDSALRPPSEVRRVLYCANVGDARAVLCRDGKATRITYDHKASDRKEARRIEKAGGEITDGRVDGVLIPTRALGDPEMKHYVTSVPHTAEIELREMDEVLIIACDGLWDVLEDQEAVDLVRHTQDAMEAAQRLLDEATRRKTSDNVTVLVVRLQGPPE
ncbi:protein serine/threonine phosphatase 2C [Lenzites betulinus]|nr:protein serine/threonine phosphatase 2C [Lenzites betulinus]